MFGSYCVVTFYTVSYVSRAHIYFFLLLSLVSSSWHYMIATNAPAIRAGGRACVRA